MSDFEGEKEPYEPYPREIGYCPHCHKRVAQEVARYECWIRTGGTMNYSITVQVFQNDDHEFVASTVDLGFKHQNTFGRGQTEEDAVNDLRRLLGHKEKTDEPSSE